MLTVVNVGYPFAPVTADAIGGAEQVLSRIDRALVAAGHRSIVIAPVPSQPEGELVALDAMPDVLTDESIAHGRHACRRTLDALLDREQVDVVHFHGVDCAEYLPRRDDVPRVVTLHLWPNRYPAALVEGRHPNLELVCVSQAQRTAMPSGNDARRHTIRNGVDLDAAASARAPERRVALLGRISPEKGFHLAIDAARAAGLSVVLAGAVFPYRSHREYFDYLIQPRLCDRVTFVGPIAGMRKHELLATSLCVGVPSIVHETSSLAAMEALGCGTPVVALRSPALEELIDHGRTGYLVKDVDEMTQAFRDVERLPRAGCRRAAEASCSATAMTNAYLRLYDQLATSSALAT